MDTQHVSQMQLADDCPTYRIQAQTTRVYIEAQHHCQASQEWKTVSTCRGNCAQPALNASICADMRRTPPMAPCPQRTRIMASSTRPFRKLDATNRDAVANRSRHLPARHCTPDNRLPGCALLCTDRGQNRRHAPHNALQPLHLTFLWETDTSPALS